MKNRKIKILYVITKSNFGGAQRYVYELATSLSKDKYDVAVAFGGDGLLKEKLIEKGIKTFEIKSFKRDISFVKEFYSMLELKSLLKEIEPDVVHLNSSKAGGMGAFIARVMRINRIIFTAHGWPFYEKRNIVWRTLAWFFSYLTTLLSHKVIVVSQHDYNRHMMPFQSYKLINIQTAVPEIDFKSRDDARNILFSRENIEQHKNHFWLITNAELNNNKNLFTAIDAVVKYNETTHQKIYYSIMSDGELKEQIESYILEKKADKYITLLGYVTNGRDYLKAFDLFLLPSKKEGMPYALLEAGAAGLPSIASNVGGIPEIIDHQKNGLLINPNDYTTIINAFKILIEDKKKMDEYGKTLKKVIEDNFSLQYMVEKTEALYR